jgi:hypothetical protein
VASWRGLITCFFWVQNKPWFLLDSNRGRSTIGTLRS